MGVFVCARARERACAFVFMRACMLLRVVGLLRRAAPYPLLRRDHARSAPPPLDRLDHNGGSILHAPQHRGTASAQHSYAETCGNAPHHARHFAARPSFDRRQRRRLCRNAITVPHAGPNRRQPSELARIGHGRLRLPARQSTTTAPMRAAHETPSPHGQCGRPTMGRETSAARWRLYRTV